MGIEPTYPAWKAGIITVILISHFNVPNSTPKELPRGLSPSDFYSGEGSRVLVWTLFTITLFSTVIFYNKDVPRDRFELSTDCV